MGANRVVSGEPEETKYSQELSAQESGRASVAAWGVCLVVVVVVVFYRPITTWSPGNCEVMGILTDPLAVQNEQLLP